MRACPPGPTPTPLACAYQDSCGHPTWPASHNKLHERVWGAPAHAPHNTMNAPAHVRRRRTGPHAQRTALSRTRQTGMCMSPPPSVLFIERPLHAIHALYTYPPSAAHHPRALCTPPTLSARLTHLCTPPAVCMPCALCSSPPPSGRPPLRELISDTPCRRPVPPCARLACVGFDSPRCRCLLPSRARSHGHVRGARSRYPAPPLPATVPRTLPWACAGSLSTPGAAAAPPRTSARGLFFDTRRRGYSPLPCARGLVVDTRSHRRCLQPPCTRACAGSIPGAAAACYRPTRRHRVSLSTALRMLP
ncbi:hypothetical protein GGX14DRAFT_559023 [Mycena pura]|uniref:Uncharacterized protein n=1 Tax=Mycena pura TaxID=153505 RepID=A0AAD6VXB3_9AGAR|nr:hypothetical protein GGX14DRAFT_559023 [Mycena pura]